MPLTNVTVLFDSYYLCPNVTRACAKRRSTAGWAWRRRTATSFPMAGTATSGKLCTYGANALKRLGRLGDSRGARNIDWPSGSAGSRKLGRVKLVFSRRAQREELDCDGDQRNPLGRLASVGVIT